MEQKDKSDLLLAPLKTSEPHLPESVVVGGCYEVIIKSVYDLSKFWIVLKFEELFIFMKYLKDFYSTVTNRKVIPKHELKKDLLCIVKRNSMYYRSIVLPVLLPDENKIRVFIIDFGLIVNVYIDEVFYIFQKHCNVPRFAIRASLANISPVDQQTWSQSDLRTFCEIIERKRIMAEVCQMDTRRKIVFIEIQVVNGDASESANCLLVNTGRAIYNNNYHLSKTGNKTKYKSKVKYLHLFPSFEALENGRVPCSLWEYNLLKGNIPLDILYKNYYQYEDSNVANGVS